MRRKPSFISMLFAIVVLATLFLLVTSISSFANTDAPGPLAPSHLQQTTPTPTDSDASVAGSTDGIVWMGIVIALIVLVPMLVTRLTWSRQTN